MLPSSISRAFTVLVLPVAITACRASPSAVPTGRHAAASSLRDTRPCPRGLLVPATRAHLGADDPSAMPPAEVEIPAFCIDDDEIGAFDYADCVVARHCPAPRPACREDDASAGCLDYESVSIYCAWRGGRVPTDAEWEVAARGTDGRKYPWGNHDDRLARFEEIDGRERSAPYDVSPFGARRMATGKWEWTSTEAPPDPQWASLSAVSHWMRGAGGPVWTRSAIPTDVGATRFGGRCAYSVSDPTDRSRSASGQ